MRFGWANLLAAGVVAHPPPAGAQRVGEIGFHTVATTGAPALWAGGVYAALRPSLRLRIAATAAAGVASDEAAGRGELLAHFLLNPTAPRGPGFYAGGGVAGVVGSADAGFLVLLVGVEGRPGAPSGWALEAGLGAGVRLAVGYRWRRSVG